MNSIDEYISQFTGETKQRLMLIKNTIKKAAPEAIEKISWAMPTFYLDGYILHFAAAKNHIGLYPGAQAIIEMSDELIDYKTSKGAIQFQNNEPIPYDLIIRIVKFKINKNKKNKE